MKRDLSVVAVVAALLGGFVSGCRTVPAFDGRRRADLARAVLSDWPPAPRLAAANELKLYGPPDGVALRALGWKNVGPWKRIVVWSSAGGDDGGMTQTVAYRVPENKRADLAAIRGGVGVSSDGRELSARSIDERMNCLALNLADEVVRGARSPREARIFYDRTVELAASGKSSPYMRTLRFPPQD